MKKIFILFLISSFTSCATYKELSGTGAGIMAWKNDLSAALVIPAGSQGVKACMQMALTMNDTQTKANANISESILGVVNKLPQNPSEGDLAKLSGELTKVSDALNVSTERTSFLLVGGFYICQLQANGLNNSDVKTLMNTLIASGAGIGSSPRNQP